MNMLALLSVLVPVVGQANDEVSETEIARLLHPSFHAQASEYKFFLDRDHAKRLTLVDKPVMSWKGEGGWYGDVFVWTYASRPQLIGCVGSWPIGKQSRDMFHEFHALTQKPLQPHRLSARHAWRHDEPGVEFKDFQGPAWKESSSRRLFQMRSVARQFTGHMNDNDGKPTVLRMLTQPIYRYKSAANVQRDGAIFSFVWDVGTDPELMLVIETEKRDDMTMWRYAAARFTWRELWLTRDDATVWSVAEHREQHETRTLKKSYVTVEVEPRTIQQLRGETVGEEKQQGTAPANRNE